MRGSQSLFWDANGNLSQMVDCKTGSASINFWDEENRLRLAVNPKFAGYYAYDANGERVYKLTGSTQYDDLNGSNPSFGIIIDGITLYPSPYIVLTEKQYTKHYYIGSEKIATMIGDGGILLETNHLSNEQRSLINDGFYRTFEPTAFQYDKTPNIDIQGMHTYQLEYKCGCIEQVDLYLMSVNSMLEPMMTTWQNSNGCKNEIYYTHSNHLGSANWITDDNGKPIQYIHYAPYGELIANKQTIGYDERFKFTGKERDWETGYDYFGARFYDHRKGFWNSVDPLADKYPNVTPYLYCNGNPIMLVDPTGEWIAVVSNDDTGTSYTVVGGSVDVEDCNVYVVGNDYDPNSGIKPQGATILGQTATPYSFCNEKGNIVPGAVINMEDKSGDAFLAQFQTGEIPLWKYVFDDPNQEGNLSGRNNGNCDFKCGGDVNRGMPLSILGGKIGTARDVGNFAAGYLSGVHGIPLLFTRIAFDCLQKGIEPPVSRSAQNIGYFTGYYKYLIQQNHDTK